MSQLATKALTTFTCYHCHETAPVSEKIIFDNKDFCCHGCKSVYQILNDNGLNTYYKIKEDENAITAPVKQSNEDYSYMDQAEFINEFVELKDNKKVIKFYIEGIHCMACLWLIEKLPDLLDGLYTARLNISNSTALFTLDNNLKISTLAHMLKNFGYTPHPLKLMEDAKKHQIQEERKELLRIGVAGAGMMNVMLYAASNYAGADGGYKDAFNWISFGFTLPVMFYSAKPFYTSTLQALKMKTVSIDIPIALAISVSFILSFAAFFTSLDHYYFDSIVSLVFLILLSRYFVKKGTQGGLNVKGIQTFFTNKGILKKSGSEFVNTHSKFINEGDNIKILAGDKLTFDGLLLSDKARIDSSILTGESKPQALVKGQEVFAGTVNLGQDIIMKVENLGKNTRIGKIMAKIESSYAKQSQIIQKADQISKVFVYAVLLIASLTFSYTFTHHGLTEALSRMLAIFIISCPCALALATPLAFIRSLDFLKANGIFIKNDRILEKISETKNIILDKTGTLTKGKFELIETKLADHLTIEEVAPIVVALEQYSTHPIATSLMDKLTHLVSDTPVIRNFKETNGVGVSGTINEKDYLLTAAKTEDRDETQSAFTQIGLYSNDKLVARFILGDSLKENTEKYINLLQKDYEIYIASGDHEDVVQQTGAQLNIKKSHLFAAQAPEDKENLIESLEHTMMVGDGANDALALTKANIGIAIGGSVDLSMRASDIFLTSSSVENIYKLITTSLETNSVIKRNFVFSILYNLVGVVLAIGGFITPLWAAVFMPLSSLTVLLSSYIGTRKLNRLMKGKS
jgi:heavy metal translocating P-type ATPase